MSEERLLRAREVARALALSERQVWNLSRRGVLGRVVRVGRSTRWRESAVRALIAGDALAGSSTNDIGREREEGAHAP